ncbi:MAG: ISL3 family transposase [Solirubrobacteraceae bacterium]
MRGRRVWKKLLGLGRAVVEDAFIESETLVVKVRPKARERGRCPHCRRRCPRYDQGEGTRRWRALDFGTTLVYLEAAAPRVSCERHGVIVAAVPWARHRSGFTVAFEDTAAWLAVNTSKKAVAQLMRINWRTVGWICERVMADEQAGCDLLAGLTCIGIDEIATAKGQRYMVVVVDHDTGRLVWAHPGRDKATVYKFLDALGAERCAKIELVSCDDAEWIQRPIAERCCNATICLDPFHIVKAATDALDEIRREVWNQARKSGQPALAKELKGARFVLWKNAEKLTERQQAKLARVQKLNQRLYRAYLLAQQLRLVYRVPAEEARVLLDAWLSWARRSRLEPFGKLARRITEQRQRVEAAFINNLSNARVEQVNTQIRLIMRRGFGYHSPWPVIALAMLSLGGLCPPLPAEGA